MKIIPVWITGWTHGEGSLRIAMAVIGQLPPLKKWRGHLPWVTAPIFRCSASSSSSKARACASGTSMPRGSCLSSCVGPTLLPNSRSWPCTETASSLRLRARQRLAVCLSIHACLHGCIPASPFFCSMLELCFRVGCHKNEIAFCVLSPRGVSAPFRSWRKRILRPEGRPCGRLFHAWIQIRNRGCGAIRFCKIISRRRLQLLILVMI